MSSERKLLIKKDPWWGEHIHRYNTALEYIQPTSNVLDIACGTGYGSEILSSKAASVIGGDIDANTISENKSYYKAANLSFEVLDGTNLQFDDNFFDTVISFETIEHTTAYHKMILEFNRVLKPGGHLVISTPNKHVTSPNGIISNPYHTQEFGVEEFRELIASSFPNVKVFGQRYSRYDSKISWTYSLAKWVESFLYFRLVRKIPIAIQDAIIQSLIGQDLYPSEQDYRLVEDMDLIKKCVTQIIVATK